MLRVTINGAAHEFKEQCTILQALQSHGIEVPTLCHDNRLRPSGNCRLCLVRVSGLPRPVTACNTQISEGMQIETHTPEIESYRRSILELLARNYPADASQQNSNKEFPRLLRTYRLFPGGAESAARTDDSHPYIHVDMSRCILCYRCVRICDEVQGQRVWSIQGRGAATRIVPNSGSTLRTSTCVACGACVDTCPTDALQDKSVAALGEPTRWTRTVCPYCGTGCELDVGTSDHQIVAVRPVMNATVNKGHLCIKGRYAFGFVRAPDRVTEPMIREKTGGWRRVSWGDAIAFAAERIERAIEGHGPDSVGILGSARATNEENYLAQKFSRVVVGTNNVDCCARVCHAPSAAGLKAMLGASAATNSFDDIEQARTILVFGCNPLENHPIVGARIRQAARQGAALIVVDPRGTELCQDACVHLGIRPGTNVALLNAMACTVLENGLADRDFLAQHVTNLEPYAEFIRAWTPERAASICGLEPVLIRRAAILYATQKPAISFHGLGLTEHIQGTEGVECLVNLALLTGNLGKPGTGINPLRGQNNVQGTAVMGCDPKLLTGSAPVEAARELFESTWGTPLPRAPGLNLMEMMDAALAGRMKTLWIMGYDIYMTNPQTEMTDRALSSLDCVIVQDLFLTETARHFGSVFLPACSSFEKDGTFMNSERRIQRVRRVLPPLPDSKPDWEIICRMATAMGKANRFSYRSSEDIWDEIRSVWPSVAGITYQRIEPGGIQWPCPSDQHGGTPVLPLPDARRIAFRTIPYQPTTEQVTAEFPMLLTTGRTLYQFNAGTMTQRTLNAELGPTDLLEISPDDATRLGLHDSELAVVRSRYGVVVLPAHVNSGMRAGELFATFHVPALLVNQLTGAGRDRETDTPEYKVTAVRVERSIADSTSKHPFATHLA